MKGKGLSFHIIKVMQAIVIIHQNRLTSILIAIRKLVRNMAVQKIEEYRQKNGIDILKVILKPTKAFPNGGYFYTDAGAITLVQERAWHLDRKGNGVRVEAQKGYTKCKFHQELCHFYRKEYADCLDHINMVEIDNAERNLNIVTNQQNLFNRFTRGYAVNKQTNSKLRFRPRIQLNGQNCSSIRAVEKEDEACILQNEIETTWLKKEMGDNYYMFDFLKYRRASEDILDLERTGQISEEEAMYRHVLKYAENKWYYLRFGLQDYFKQYHIPVPKCEFDENDFMVHPITGQKLCPF